MQINTATTARSIWAALLGAATLLVAVRLVWAEEVTVPISLQAELLVKVAAYDRNLPARGEGPALVLLLVKTGSGDSERATAQMEGALAGIATIAGRRHVEERVAFRSADELAKACRERHPAIVYVAPGLGDQVPALAAALKGTDVLSTAAIPGYVPRGVVLGFDLQSGRPKLLVHLGQATAQHVAFDPKFLSLAEVVDR